MSNKEFTSVCKQRKIAFIGAGNMASAIINGWLDSGTVSSEDIIVFDVDKSKYDNFRKKGVNIADGVGDAVEFAEYVFLALKPAFIKTALENIMQVTDSFKSKDKVFISIAAAVPTTFICHVLAYQVPVIRVMPNTPMLIGHGAVAICKNSFVGKKQFEFICRILSNLSTLQVIEESEMNAIISVNGSSPAYVYLFVKSMLDSAVSQGISADVALPLILQSVVG